MTVSEVQRRRNALGTARAHHPEDSALVAQRRRELAEAKIEAAIRKAVDSAPPLTPEQRDRLSVLLRGDAA